MRLLASLLLVVGLSACTIEVQDESATDKPTATAPATTQAPPTPEDTSDQDFVDFLTESDSEFGLVPSAELLEAGQSACAALDTGATLDEILVAVSDSGLTGDQIAFLIVGSVQFLCPEHLDSVREQSEHISSSEV